MNNNMSTHSDVSFDESEVNRILSGLLESQRTIKTFFGENDKTPNHDGFFEMIGQDGIPQKQFIVQIKHVKKFFVNRKGSNKGKNVSIFQRLFSIMSKAVLSRVRLSTLL